MEPIHYAILVFALYGAGIVASFTEKLSAYRFSLRYEDVSRSRETKREVKEIRAKLKEEVPWSFVWPVEIWRIYKREGK